MAQRWRRKEFVAFLFYWHRLNRKWLVLKCYIRYAIKAKHEGKQIVYGAIAFPLGMVYCWLLCFCWAPLVCIISNSMWFRVCVCFVRHKRISTFKFDGNVCQPENTYKNCGCRYFLWKRCRKTTNKQHFERKLKRCCNRFSAMCMNKCGFRFAWTPAKWHHGFYFPTAIDFICFYVCFSRCSICLHCTAALPRPIQY